MDCLFAKFVLTIAQKYPLLIKEPDLKKRVLLPVLFITAFCLSAFAKTTNGGDTLTVSFWNVENLYDTDDDPLKDDAEFLPNSANAWTNERLETKLKNLASVINLMNNGKGPDVMGFAEVEHQALLDKLIANYLNNKDYGVVYAESPDARGIDVGLIYNKNKLTFISMKADSVFLPDKYATRLILNANLCDGNDTIHFFVNHWPSRRGGAEKSEVNRVAAAQVLKGNLNDLLSRNSNSKIIMMGDFNDDPTDKSITQIVGAEIVICDSIQYKSSNGISNLALRKFNTGDGSYLFQGKFSMIDQMLVSNSVLNGLGIKYICESFEVFRPAFMVTQTGKYKGGSIPTFGGKNYLGGYSDHFPVTAKFVDER